MAAKKKPNPADEAATQTDAPEEWRSVPGFAGLYEVSTFGRVRSLPRETRAGILGGRILRGQVSTAGYERVTLSCGGNSNRYSVHRLVLAAFVGAQAPDHEGRHLNGNRTDNRLSNLMWGTRSENASDRTRHGTQYDNRGERHGNSRLTDAQAQEIKSLRASGYSLRRLSEMYGVSAQTICYVSKTGWEHVGGAANG